ncbi:MAG: hypothetical protein ACTHOO_01285 [Alcanivorax sp.]
MMIKKSLKIAALFCCTIGLSACQTSQSTSGQSYVDRYNDVPVSKATVNAKNGEFIYIDQKVREVAAVEPILKFPGRYGIARVERGKIATIPEAEMELWLQVKEEQGARFGDFIPLSPLVADMTSSIAGIEKNSTTLVDQVRLGAARQHLDAVLLYEVYSQGQTKSNLLKAGNLTIIGHYILPSEQVSAVGYANAMLIDVVQGYPYGNVSATSKEFGGLSTGTNKRVNALAYAREAKTDAVAALTPQVNQMITNLRLAMVEQNI